MDLDQGLLREALTSLHSLFASTREILRGSGPDVGARRESVGGIAIAVLNKGIRPFLSKWHPELQAWEVQRTFTVGAKDHERSWSKETQLRRELNALRDSLGRYAAELAKLAGVDHY